MPIRLQVTLRHHPQRKWSCFIGEDQKGKANCPGAQRNGEAGLELRPRSPTSGPVLFPTMSWDIRPESMAVPVPTQVQAITPQTRL